MFNYSATCHEPTNLATLLADCPNYARALAKQASQVTHTRPTSLQLDGCTVNLLPASASGAIYRQATSLVRASKSDKPTNSETLVWCRYSGTPLYRCDATFPRDHMRVATHWIFDATWKKLEQLESSYTYKNHEQRNLLVLAFLMQPTTLGTRLHLRHPIQLPELACKRRYHQILTIARTIHGMSEEQRTKLLADMPHFDTKALVVTPTKIHAGQWTSELLQLGQNFMDYLDTVIEYLQVSAYWQPDLLMEGCISAAEVEKLGTLLYQELTSKPKQEAGLDEYWNYILDEVSDAFDLPTSEVVAFAEQLGKPTDSNLLEQLLTYLKGLQEVYQFRGSLYQIPAAQFKQAISAVAMLLAELQFSVLDLTEKPRPATQPLSFSVVADPTDLATNQQASSQATNKPASPALSRLANLTSRISVIATKQEAKQEARLQAALDKVANLTAKFTSQPASQPTESASE